MYASTTGYHVVHIHRLRKLHCNPIVSRVEQIFSVFMNDIFLMLLALNNQMLKNSLGESSSKFTDISSNKTQFILVYDYIIAKMWQKLLWKVKNAFLNDTIQVWPSVVCGNPIYSFLIYISSKCKIRIELNMMVKTELSKKNNKILIFLFSFYIKKLFRFLWRKFTELSCCV